MARVRPVLQGQVRVLFEKVPSSQSLFLAPSEGYLHSLRLFSTTKLTIRNGSDKELLPLRDGISLATGVKAVSCSLEQEKHCCVQLNCSSLGVWR